MKNANETIKDFAIKKQTYELILVGFYISLLIVTDYFFFCGSDNWKLNGINLLNKLVTYFNKTKSYQKTAGHLLL